MPAATSCYSEARRLNEGLNTTYAVDRELQKATTGQTTVEHSPKLQEKLRKTSTHASGGRDVAQVKPP